MSDEKPRLTRRAVLAAIALAPASPPESIKFDDEQPAALSIRIDLGNDMHAFREWCALLGVTDDWIRHQTYTPAEHGQPGEPFEMWNAVAFDQWGYRQVHLSADEKGSDADQPLPVETVQALTSLVDERETPETRPTLEGP